MKYEFVKELERDQLENDTIYFCFNPNWNDFGIHLSYGFYLKDIIDAELGYRFLILDRNNKFVDETEVLDICTLEDLKARHYHFWGFSENLQLYDLLGKKYGSQKLERILKDIHDITVIKDGIESINISDDYDNNITHFFSVTRTPKQRLIDFGLLRFGNGLYNLVQFCKKIAIDFVKLVSREEKGIDNKEFIEYFNKFINGQYTKDVDITEYIKEITCRLKSVDEFLANLKQEDIVKFVGVIISDTNYYLDISKMAPNVLGKQDLDIIERICDIQEILGVKEVPDNLGQYTSLGTLEYLLPILKNKCDSNLKKDDIEDTIPSIRLTNGNQLNDPMEGRVLFSYLGIESDRYESTMNYLASATISKDNLPMWKQYGEDAKGIFLIFDKKSFSNKLINMRCIFKICYLDPNDEEVKIADSEENQRIRIKEDLKFIKNKIADLCEGSKEDNSETLQKWSRYMDNLKFLFKKSEYSYENEYRILLNQQDLKKIIPQRIEGKNFGYKLFTYIYEDDVKLLAKFNEIMIGPKSIKDMNYIAEYINYCDKSIKVTASKINYR